MRVFPISNNWEDVVSMFKNIIKQWWITIKYGEWITNVQKNWSKFLVTSNISTYKVDQIVLTTWWNAFSHTGSTWDGYQFARSLGHTITQLWPSLNSFVTKQNRIYPLSWLSFSHATIHIPKQNIKKSWPLLITHFGISWPLTFIVASETAFETIAENSPIEIRLQPLSDYNFDKRNSYLLDSSLRSKKELITILANKLPRRFCEALLAELEIQQHTAISQLNKAHRTLLANQLWNWINLSLIKRRPWDEFVTAGWVTTSEINPETLESNICPWLYFAGEILNIDGVTGGYNLQMCWSTGRCVGMNIWQTHT